ncbi:ferredoxin reductase [Streptomyces griseus]|nr:MULTISPECIES: ferredoxin reductase [Streptomyces]MYR14603.1 2Fe-2S iron-sulfur cluster binding domain-containing protein [Streptomyces sp. SID724]MYR47983.1 2Fe-2S iron-sulfur cluster binding domain-containing protein [Streptomyces sp. SID4928]EGE39901.1 Oxidoreductase FAD-binding domain protein [Streptomyces sp. ACT-1]MBW3702858.1 ferredoxin reductase [Streptomyces griseus]NEB51956.1 ferredoxin reductase [Streptomyces griseus]
MVTTPLLPSDYLDLVSPLRAGADLCGRIEAVRPETGDAATVVIRPGRGWRGHTAGQYVRIGVDVDGVRLWRAYSLTSPAHRQDGRITITVKAIPDGRVSNHLVRRAKPGTLVRLDQPTGDFVLSRTAPAKVFFLTAGSGITPVMGMLRDRELDDVVMVHCAPRPQDVIFREELHALVAAGRLRLTEVHTATDGVLDIARLDELVPDWAERETWACGPTGLLDAAEDHWSEHGVQERLHTERFRPGVVVAGEGGEVTFSASGRTVAADGATPLLDVGEEAGVLMPSGCRMGICFGCVTPLKAGAVRDLRTGGITEAEPGVLIQTCVSAAAGPCDIER